MYAIYALIGVVLEVYGAAYVAVPRSVWVFYVASCRTVSNIYIYTLGIRSYLLRRHDRTLHSHPSPTVPEVRYNWIPRAWGPLLEAKCGFQSG